MSFSLPAILWMNILPGVIAAKIAGNNGLPPLLGFACGFLASWPGMIAFAIINGIIASNRSVVPAAKGSRRAAGQSRQSQRAREAVLRKDRAAVAELRDEITEALAAADAERRRDADRLRMTEAELQARDTLVEQHERELERLRSVLQDAEERLKRDMDPWYDTTIAAETDSFPDVLPADMPRSRFDGTVHNPVGKAAADGSAEHEGRAAADLAISQENPSSDSPQKQPSTAKKKRQAERSSGAESTS